MKKIFLIIFILFPFFVSASSMYQEIDILEKGDLKIRESITKIRIDEKGNTCLFSI